MKKETINRLAELKARHQEIQMQEFKLWDERYHIEKEIDKIMKDEHPCPDCNTVGKLRSEDGVGETVWLRCRKCDGTGYFIPGIHPKPEKEFKIDGKKFLEALKKTRSLTQAEASKAAKKLKALARKRKRKFDPERDFGVHHFTGGREE